MRHPEEGTAKELHRELTRRLGDTHTAISMTGKGVHWKCLAVRANSECSIACFRLLAPEYYPEYYTTFVRDGDTLATARTTSKDETIDSVCDWLNEKDLSYLHSRYRFVDRTKRALTRIRDAVVAEVPDLQDTENSTLRHQGGDIYSLRFRVDDRSCEVSFYGKNEHPDAKFSWDDCQLFEFRADDVSRLAAVLSRWLCHESMPSTMRTDFPWLQIGELADYYENGKPIEGEFI